MPSKLPVSRDSELSAATGSLPSSISVPCGLE